MGREDSLLLAKLLVATCAVIIRTNPTMRGQIVRLLVRDHCDEVVNSVVAKLV